jgi:hypothetical protein
MRLQNKQRQQFHQQTQAHVGSCKQHAVHTKLVYTCLQMVVGLCTRGPHSIQHTLLPSR